MSETAARKDIQKLQRAVVDGLEDVKAHDIRIFNTEHLTPLFERVIVATGNSNRQTKALAASVRDKVREAGFDKPRMEGEDNGEWIIIDCGAAVAHVMQPAIRQYYNLEEIWGDKPVRLRGAVVRKATSARVAEPTKKPDAMRAQPARAKRSAGAPAAAKKKTAAKPAAGRAGLTAARKTATGQSVGARTAAGKKVAMKKAASSRKTAARGAR